MAIGQREAVDFRVSVSHGKTMKYVAIIAKTGNGYSAHLLDIPRCIAAADTFEETRDLIQEAATYHLEIMAEHGEAIPEPNSVAVEVEVQLPAPAAPSPAVGETGR